MNNILKNVLLGLLVTGIVSSCTKMKSIGILNTGNYSDTAATLQSAAGSMIIGFEAYLGDANFAKYFPIIAREGSAITPGNELKYGSIVQDDGTFNYTQADALVNQAISAGLQVYGHNLVWYSQQNQTYLTSIVGAVGSGPANLVTNGDFENWSNSASAPPSWSYYNGGTYFSQGTGANAEGNYSMAVKSSGLANNYNVQLATTVPTVIGHIYNVTFDAMATSNTGNVVQGEWSNNSGPQYTGGHEVTTGWNSYSFRTWNPSGMNNLTATTASTTITFDVGLVPAGTTVYIDNVKVIDQTLADEEAAASSDAAVNERLDSVLNLWINSTVSRYAGKIKAWDVLNEPLAEDGTIRTNNNLPSGTSVTSPGIFVWSNYLGKQTGVSAFKYAHEADPNALLFINEYNLESNSVKLDSLIAYVKYLQAAGVQVDGIGTQMHCDINTSVAGIDAMFQALAATGLKIKITELDVTMKPSPTDATVGDPITLGSQATMYKYIVSSYMKNVPAAQRYGITLWGVDDPDSWRKAQLPLLWDKNFAKKPAYAGFLQGLQQQQ